MIIVVGVSSVYNICFLLEDGTPIIILVCVNDNCRGRFIYVNFDFSAVIYGIAFYLLVFAYANLLLMAIS